ncbi:hypothetical protein GCM10023340_23150 [Nocardioides marinquilinus]|uniref:Uncharacterized protein n=1 Tax=Nocardioides marinquilinus TaxID=1210400 RepID=A0ABP9PPH9_9ACTN
MSLRTDITRPRSSRSRMGLLVAVLALGGTLTACSNAGNVTCGEFSDQDAGAKRDTVVDLIEDSDDDNVKDTLDGFEGEERDLFLDGIAEFVTSECDSKGDDDTEIGEYVYQDF